MKYDLCYYKEFAENLRDRAVSLVNQTHDNPQEYGWLKSLIHFLMETADTIDQLVDSCVCGNLPQEMEEDMKYVELTQKLRVKALVVRERAPRQVNFGKGGLLSELLDKASDIIVSLEYRAFDQLNSAEGNDSKVQTQPKPAPVPDPDSTDTSLQAKYDDLKILWDMYGGEEGITRAFQKADILDKVVGKISEALAMLPPETESGERK